MQQKDLRRALPMRLLISASGISAEAWRSLGAVLGRLEGVVDDGFARVSDAVTEKASRLPRSGVPTGRVLGLRALAAHPAHAAAHLALLLTGSLLALPIFGGDFPPGVDTPTFLHLGWIAEQAIKGRLDSTFVDPYWYGGFPYLKAYPPLGYGLMGFVSAVTTLSIGVVYSLFMLLSVVVVAVAVYWLGLEIGLRRMGSLVAALVTILAYPTLAALFLWGWFTSLFALALLLVGLLFLIKSLRTGRLRDAVVAGMFFALTALSHHMTAFAFLLALAAWFAVQIVGRRSEWRLIVRQSAIAAGVAVLIAGPWVVIFTVHVLDVGFRREIPGNWLVPFEDWRRNALNAKFIGVYWYPSYLGSFLVPATAVGVSFALTWGARWASVAAVLLVLVAFSLGAATIPLYRSFPFSGMDASRFPLYMAPFTGLMAGAAFQGVASLAQGSWPALRRRIPRAVLIAALLATVFWFVGRDAVDARQAASPYRVAPEVARAIAFLRSEAPSMGDDQRVFSVGFWTWNNFLVPYLAGNRLAEGWADEGATTWRPVRQLRHMSWSGQIDPRAAHALLSQLGVRWVVVYNSYILEHPVQWSDAMKRRPDLFQPGPTWGAVSTYRVQ